jgi:hypothetical protein
MKIKTTFTCLLLLLVGSFLGGCTTASQLNDIHIGMSKDQVIAILGKPDSTSAQSNVEYMTYYLSNDQSYRDQPYSVRLLDGKVESYGRFAQLFDIYNRPVTSARPGDPNFPQSNLYGGVSVSPRQEANDLVRDLERLRVLKERGVLTEEEFQRAKERVISGATGATGAK